MMSLKDITSRNSTIMVIASLILVLLAGFALVYISYLKESYDELLKERNAVIRMNNKLLEKHNELFQEHKKLATECYNVATGGITEKNACREFVIEPEKLAGESPAADIISHANSRNPALDKVTGLVIED